MRGVMTETAAPMRVVLMSGTEAGIVDCIDSTGAELGAEWSFFGVGIAIRFTSSG